MILFIHLTIILFSLTTVAKESCLGETLLKKVNSTVQEVVALTDELNCQELPIQKSRVVNIDWNENPNKNNTELKYRLTRLSQKKYRVELPVQFNGNDAEKMYSKAKICLNTYNDYLKTESGDTIELKVIHPKIAKKDPELKEIITPISIEHEPKFRSHSRGYADTIGCETILHELLHLTGLPDEYGGKSDDYSCRNTGKQDSIMNNQWYMQDNLNSIQGKAIIHYCYCKFQQEDSHPQTRENKIRTYLSPEILEYPSNQKVITTLSNPANINMPQQSEALIPKMKSPTPGCPSSCTKQSVERPLHYLGDIEYIKKRKSFAIIESPYDPSATEEEIVTKIEFQNIKKLKDQVVFGLQPAHFRHITNPFCFKKNKLYYGCSTWAYVKAGCEPMPPECRNNDWTK